MHHHRVGPEQTLNLTTNKGLALLALSEVGGRKAIPTGTAAVYIHCKVTCLNKRPADLSFGVYNSNAEEPPGRTIATQSVH